MKTSHWFHWKAAAASATLALLSYVSWLILDVEIKSRNLLLIRLCTGACILCAMASVACLGIPALVASDKRRRALSAATIEVDSRSGDYTAKFPTSDRVMAVCLAFVMALLTAFLWSRHAGWPLRGPVTFFEAVIVYYAYRVSALSVRFTSNRITIHMFPRAPYVQRYSAIAGVRASVGNLQIRFEDGRTVNIWSGMGEGEVVVRILQKKIDILPQGR